MNILSISLLWPDSSPPQTSAARSLHPDTAKSLDLEGLCRHLGNNRAEQDALYEVLACLPQDEAAIRYRQEIFFEIAGSAALMQAMETMLTQLETLAALTEDASKFAEDNLWRYFSRFKELDGYVACIRAMMNALQGLTLESAGLRMLRERIGTLAGSDAFRYLEATMQNLSMEINEIQSITLGVNLDSSLNPVEVTLVSVNRAKFKETSWIRGMLASKDAGAAVLMGPPSRIHGLSPDKRHPIMNHLHKDIESLMKPVVKDLSAGLRKYSGTRGNVLLALAPEIRFYLRFARLYHSLRKTGMPACRPEILPMERRTCRIRELYNVNLAIHFSETNPDPSEEIILNDANFDENGRILLLTGPNRGGKTVFTEAIGLAQILFQAGVFVPGVSAAMSPVDCVFSHFPVDENQTVELGRLGEETKRLNDIFRQASRFSLILLNESLSSTSYLEGLYIAQDVVKSMRYMETRAVFNTHMHELAGHSEQFNLETTGDSLVVSLVTGIVDGERSFRVLPGAPLGKSYAMDIARKFGISFEQLALEIDARR